MSRRNGPVMSQQGYRYEPISDLSSIDKSMSRHRAKKAAALRKKKAWLRANAAEHTVEEICAHCKWAEGTAKKWIRQLELRAKDFNVPKPCESKKSHPLFSIYSGMLQRCTNKNHPQWGDYGGRGITVCERWANDFYAFVADMGGRPSERHSIGRIDNDAGYSPENCEWQTSTEQNRNRRGRRLITLNGETKCLAEWCEHFGTDMKRVRSRLRLGWDVYRALTAPKRGYRL